MCQRSLCSCRLASLHHSGFPSLSDIEIYIYIYPHTLVQVEKTPEKVDEDTQQENVTFELDKAT